MRNIWVNQMTGAARPSTKLEIECQKRKNINNMEDLPHMSDRIVLILCTRIIHFFIYLKSTTEGPDGHNAVGNTKKIHKYTQYVKCNTEEKQNININVWLHSFELHSNKYGSAFCTPMYIAYTFRRLAFAAGSVIGVSRLTGTREAALGVNAAATSTTTSVVRCTLVDICVITSHINLYNSLYRYNQGPLAPHQ